jgi:hypothetical protein
MNKEEKIADIKRIIKNWGSTTTSELELCSSPCIMSTGNKTNVSQLVEGFNADDVDVISYVNETEVSDDSLEYEELSDDIIDEIHSIILDYEVDCEKAMKRSLD